MKLRYSILLLLLSLTAAGQDYHRLIRESFFWDVPVSEPGYLCAGYSEFGPYRYRFSGDTVIDDNTYAKIFRSEFISQLEPPAPNCPPFLVDTIFTSQPVFLREDTIQKKVWRLTTSNGPEEILLFDFSVNQGDTIKYEGFPDAIIDTVYTILTNDGKTRKRFEFGPASSFPGGYFIEGIGGAGGLVEVPYHMFEWGTWLQCVKNEDGTIVWDNSSGCFEFLTRISNNFYIDSVSIFPNPSTGIYYILNSSHTEFEITIYNLHGHKVHSETNSSHFDISNLNSGIYIVVFQIKGIVFRSQIIKY